jgi:hypothetical protein
MTTKEQRQHDRIASLNLLNYVGMDENDQEMAQGMGRTLNVSESGILLETHIPMEEKTFVLLTIGLEDELVDIRGKVAHSKPGKEGKFEAGIRFLESDETAHRVLKKYVDAFSGTQ